MGNWFKIVSNAYNAFQLTPPEKTFLVEHTPESFTLQTIYDITTRGHQNKKNKIINNIQVAAMHLGYIQQGNLDFIDDEVNNKINEQLPSAKGIHNFRRLRVPLTMAAFISPICLLMPKKLYDTEVKRETILEVWQCLGNQRPQAIQSIEEQLWTLLNSLYCSHDIENNILYALEKIAEESKKIQSQDENLGTWFKNDTNISNNTAFGTIVVQDIEYRVRRILEESTSKILYIYGLM